MPKKKKITEARAIVCLILNILILPGLGSLIGRKKKQGIWQLVLFLVGIPLVLVLVGIPMMIAAWVWGIVTGVELLDNSK
jgi:TM2 domain-containing membrane protein YozV